MQAIRKPYPFSMGQTFSDAVGLPPGYTNVAPGEAEGTAISGSTGAITVLGLGLGVGVSALIAALNGYAGQRWFGSDAQAKSIAWDSAKGAAIITAGLSAVILAFGFGKNRG